MRLLRAFLAALAFAPVVSAVQHQALRPQAAARRATAIRLDSLSLLADAAGLAIGNTSNASLKETANATASAKSKEVKPWHQDVDFLAHLMMIMLPCMLLAVGVFEWSHRQWAEVDFNAPLPASDNPDESRTDIAGMLRGIGPLTRPYFGSPAGRKGRIYCLVVVLLGVCALFLALVHNAWQKEFWDTFEHKQSERFFYLLSIFAILVTTFVLNDVYSQYIRQMLYIHWRDFMTRNYVRRWLGASAYYTMQLDVDPHRRVENPDQRIQEDIHLFVDTTIIISYEFLNSLGHLIVFLPLLLMLSPTRAFGIWYCPGWLLYLAFIYSLLGTLATHGIGRSLIPVGFARQQFEADFRFGLVRVRDHSESIVLYHGERSEELNLQQRFERIKAMWWQYMLYSKRLAYFTRAFGFVQMIIPFFILAPSYFKGDISMGTLFQITAALGTVCTSFDMIVNTYGTLAAWRATADRLLGFDAAMREAKLLKTKTQSQAMRYPGPPDRPVAGEDPKNLGLAVENLTVRLPDGGLLWKDLSFAITRGRKVLITGREGIGKSILFRVLAGAWPYVESGHLWCVPPEPKAADGEASPEAASRSPKEGMDSESNEEEPTVRCAAGRRVLFVPQRSYFPAFCNLRGALSYPEPPQVYSDTELLAALRDVKLDVILDGDINNAPEAEAKGARGKGGGAKDNGGNECSSTPVCQGRGLDMIAKWNLVLSPGQQQRLAFARVLLLRPDLLFLDEATSNLSQESTRELYMLMTERLGSEATVVSISHEVDLLAPLHDHMLVVEGDQAVGKDLRLTEGRGAKSADIATTEL